MSEVYFVGSYGIVIHAGCGVILRSRLENTETEVQCREALQKALRRGFAILEAGGSAVKAVVETIVELEDFPEFNAGKGSVFTADGRNEMDAGIMDGRSGEAGGVSNLTRVKNPIKAANEVMLTTPHSLLSGPSADSLAENWGLELCPSSYFFTERRYQALQNVLSSGAKPILDHDAQASSPDKCGTVGAVVLDKFGNLAAGSSTGGMTGKLPGRVADSCIPGAGFYADSRAAVSATGNGDFFVRRVLCKQICDRLIYTDISLKDASAEAIHEDMKDTSAGLIGIDGKGNAVMPYNTEGMFRAVMGSQSEPFVAIWDK